MGTQGRPETGAVFSGVCENPAITPVAEISLFSGADIEQYLCPNFALLVSDLPDSAIPEIAAFLVLQS